MQTPSIRLSELALSQLLATVSDAELPLLPEAAYSAKAFLLARDEWEKLGLVELDFDGALHPQPQFARMLHNLMKWRSVLRVSDSKGETYFVRGPVDLLQIRQGGKDSWQIALRPLTEARWLVNHLLHSPEEQNWELTAQALGDAKPQSAKRSSDGDMAVQARTVLQHFYKKGGNAICRKKPS